MTKELDLDHQIRIREKGTPAYHATVTECCNMAIGPDCRYCPKCGWEARREDAHRYSGELWIDKDGTANFKWHIEGGDFKAAREALVKFIECLQQRLNGEKQCPMHGNG